MSVAFRGMRLTAAMRRARHHGAAVGKREAMSDDVSANVRANYVKWDQKHHWSADGGEWTGQAALCGVSYEVWKDSLVEHLIRPHLGGEVLEIAPGHGRWSAYLIPASAFCTLVDLSPSCLDFCRQKFVAATNVDYFLTTGTSLPRYCSGQTDFVWSYDSFVHMAPAVVRAYLAEIARVLRPGGKAIIHHADIRDPAAHDQDTHPGWRSAVNREIVQFGAEAAGLNVERQFVFWDEAQRIGVPRFGDAITALKKPK